MKSKSNIAMTVYVLLLALYLAGRVWSAWNSSPHPPTDRSIAAPAAGLAPYEKWPK